MIDQAFDQAAAALWESLQTVPVDDASRVLMFAREIRRRTLAERIDDFLAGIAQADSEGGEC